MVYPKQSAFSQTADVNDVTQLCRPISGTGRMPQMDPTQLTILLSSEVTT